MIKERLSDLKKLMKEKSLDAYIVPSADAHNSEYVAKHWKSREWITGFTGSAGTAVITHTEDGLWTDGRYFIQAENQLAGSGIKLFKMGLPKTPTYTKWLYKNLESGSTVGVDGTLFTKKAIDSMEKKFSEKNISINVEYDLIDMLWEDRPPQPRSNAFDHDVKYAGLSRTEKISKVHEQMKDVEADTFLLTTLDDIAWLLNVRGADVHNNPVVVSYVVVTLDKTYWFVDREKVSDNLKDQLANDNVVIRAYSEVSKFLSELDNSKVVYDPKKANIFLVNSINSSCKTIEKNNLTTLMKAKKNPTEIENLRKVHIKDSVAMVRFLHWLDETVGNEKVSEIDASDKLEEFRSELELFKGNSFDYISAYKGNGAMMHYKATPESHAFLDNESFYLIDSGGQYLDGTTDITRTVALGSLTDEEKTDFTLTLRGHINLNRAIFLEGTTGPQLDILARQPLWNNGIDYKCGTGHGVGFFLNVHEGPHSISPRQNSFKLEEGMVITNEPGVYKQDKYGIRLENTIVVTPHVETDSGKFFKFEVISYCPIDVRAIKPELMTQEEIEWLNNYHKAVYDKLSPLVPKECLKWLKEATQSIKK